MDIYDSIIKDAVTANSTIDYSKLDFKKLQTPLKSNRGELSAGSRSTAAAKSNPTRITYSMFDSINL